MSKKDASSKTLDALEAFLVKMMKEANTLNSDMSLTDKMKIADRVLKLEALKAKMDDSTFGSAFVDGE